MINAKKMGENNNKLTFIANILLDCAELSEKDIPLLNYIKEKCRKFGVSESQDDIIRIVGRYHIVHNMGEVNDTLS